MLPNLKVGLVGAGWAARQHCDSISIIDGADVVAVFNICPGNRDALARDSHANLV